MRVVGVDAGKTGAVALLDGKELLELCDLPMDDDGTLDARLFFDWLIDWEADLLVIEDCFRVPGLLRMVGEVTAVAKVVQVPVLRIAVVTWKKKILGLNTSDKSISVKKCLELFPGAELVRPGKRTPNPDRAEAILLSVYGRDR